MSIIIIPYIIFSNNSNLGDKYSNDGIPATVPSIIMIMINIVIDIEIILSFLFIIYTPDYTEYYHNI